MDELQTAGNCEPLFPDKCCLRETSETGNRTSSVGALPLAGSHCKLSKVGLWGKKEERQKDPEALTCVYCSLPGWGIKLLRNSHALLPDICLFGDRHLLRICGSFSCRVGQW